jgi:copper(I)-binding protein
MKSRFIIVLLPLFSLFAVSCNSDEQTEQPAVEFHLPESGIDITGAWARPGRMNGVSAIYMNVLNGSSETDTLISLSSEVAELVELHETYELDNDMMGMREAEDPIFPGRAVVSMQPGGLHVMLIQLNHVLNEGDEIELSLIFAKAGEISVTAPVQSQEDRN